MRRRRVGEHLFTSCVFDPLLCLVSIFVAAVLHLYKRRKRNGLLVQVVKQREMLRLLTGNAMGRRRCYSFHSFLLIVQLFECQRAPVCFGPHLKHLASHHSHLPWT